MFKRVRKIIVMVALGTVLTVSVLGATMVIPTLTGHTPAAHADGLGGSMVAIDCYSANPPGYVIVDGENQDGQEAHWVGTLDYSGTNVFGSLYVGGTKGWWWVGTVYVTIWDVYGNLIDDSTPVWIDPSTYGTTVRTGC